MHLLIVTYATDFRMAYQRIIDGNLENYYGHKYYIETIAKLSQQVAKITVLSFKTKEPYDEILPTGFRAIGLGLTAETIKSRKGIHHIIQKIEQLNPDKLVLKTPQYDLLKWGIRNNIKMLLLWANYFPRKTITRHFKNYLYANVLNHSSIEWVANHGVNSSISLREIGIHPDKIIPWDFPHHWRQLPAKQPRQSADSWKLIYVGSIEELKGVGDLLRSIHHLKQANVSVRLAVVGSGQISQFTEYTRRLDIEEQVTFLGVVPNSTIIDLMRASDLVIVPSRHEYPEAFPLTVYEALNSRTPLIASDHPVFQGKLVHHVSAMIFPAGNYQQMAACIQQILSDPELYCKLSENAYSAWLQLQIPTKWGDILHRWIHHTPTDHQWLQSRSLGKTI